VVHSELDLMCDHCGRRTRHKLDRVGKPHCVPCIMAVSMAPAFAASSDVDPAYDAEAAAVPAQPTSPPRREAPRVATLIAAALMLALAVGAVRACL
jgi:hypothetical protein